MSEKKMTLNNLEDARVFEPGMRVTLPEDRFYVSNRDLRRLRFDNEAMPAIVSVVDCYAGVVTLRDLTRWERIRWRLAAPLRWWRRR